MDGWEGERSSAHNVPKCDQTAAQRKHWGKDSEALVRRLFVETEAVNDARSVRVQ